LTEENVVDLNGKKGKIEKDLEIINKTITLKEENSQNEAENIKSLKQISTQYEFAQKLIAQVEEDEIKKMPDTDYHYFVAPFNTLTSTADSFENIYDISAKEQVSISSQNSTINAAASLTMSGASVLALQAENEPKLYPGGKTLAASYQPRIEIESEIDYIKSQLPKITPNINKDFDEFIKRYYASKEGETRYMDLIGARSMFFLKFIFKFSEDNYRINKRPEQIEKFVLGSSPMAPLDEPIIRSGYNMWLELSSQTSSSDSVKMGRGSGIYIEGLFIRLIGVIASLLKLREKKFTK